jgi:hypothetical protein
VDLSEHCVYLTISGFLYWNSYLGIYPNFRQTQESQAWLYNHPLHIPILVA